MPSAPRRPRSDRQRNRQALLDAAAVVFGESGIDAPLDTVARRAGVSNATLYRHFPKRRDLVVAILLVSLERNAREIEKAMQHTIAWEGLQEYLSWLFAEQIKNPTHLSAMRAVPAGENLEVDGLRDAAHESLKQLLAQARADGFVRPDRYIEDLYLLLLLNESLASERLASPDAASRRFFELAIDVLATQCPSPAMGTGPDPVAVLRSTLARELAGLPTPNTPTGDGQ